MTPKRLTNFRIDSELLEGLEAIRDRDGVPVSEQVRRAIRNWLESKGIKAQGKAGGNPQAAKARKKR